VVVLFDGLLRGAGAPLGPAPGVAAGTAPVHSVTKAAIVSRSSRRFFAFSPGLVDQKASRVDAVFPRDAGTSVTTHGTSSELEYSAGASSRDRGAPAVVDPCCPCRCCYWSPVGLGGLRGLLPLCL